MGVFIILLGTINNDFGTKCAGFIVLGYGNGSLSACVPTLLTNWFKGRHISLAMGMMLSVIGAAAVVGSLAMPTIAEADGVPAAIWFCVAMQGVSYMCMLVAVFIDRHATKVDGNGEKKVRKPFQMKQLLSMGWPYWLLTASFCCKACYIVPG